MLNSVIFKFSQCGELWEDAKREYFDDVGEAPFDQLEALRAKTKVS